MDTLRLLFDTGDFPARWTCGNWSEAHGWLHILSDTAIFGAYFAIPLSILYFLRRKRDVPFPPIFYLFAAFIFACGFGHLIEATIFWHPWYRFSGAVKLFTAVVSWATVFAVIRAMPQALALPGLARMNRQLEEEVRERRRAEDAVRSSLEEKEVLLQEIHHRVKNNLQMVSSLLRLQGRRVSTDEAKVALNSCQDRIHAMGLLHERLYASPNLASIRLGEYLEEIADAVSGTYGFKDRKITLTLNLGKVEVDPRKAIPVGILFHEMLTNSAKHAFAIDRGGTITVRLDESEGIVRLVVADDGRGMKESDDPSRSLGLKLIRVMCDQIDGQLTMSGKAGVTMTVEFPSAVPEKATEEVHHVQRNA